MSWLKLTIPNSALARMKVQMACQ